MDIQNFINADIAKCKRVLEGPPISKVLSSDIPIINGNIISTALKWIEGNPQGTVKTIIGDVEITRRGIRDDFSHVAFPDKLAVLPAIKAVLEIGAYLGEMQDLNGKNIMNYYFAAPVDIDGNNKIVFIRVRKKGTGLRRFYVHDIYTLDDIKKSGANKTTGTVHKAQNKGNAPDLYKTILSRFLTVNN